jgi:hypothetical protein
MLGLLLVKHVKLEKQGSGSVEKSRRSSTHTMGLDLAVDEGSGKPSPQNDGKQMRID